jgi:hypothetical protein
MSNNKVNSGVYPWRRGNQPLLLTSSSLVELDSRIEERVKGGLVLINRGKGIDNYAATRYWARLAPAPTNSTAFDGDLEK